MIIACDWTLVFVNMCNARIVGPCAFMNRLLCVHVTSVNVCGYVCVCVCVCVCCVCVCERGTVVVTVIVRVCLREGPHTTRTAHLKPGHTIHSHATVRTRM